ncbi:hypothetical protein BDY19DRAFT_951530 [Irpex rosettiformis]|uniref:Uncharacterized protein n=1 Tax=Irpex rosettiformis TaxID=378272 RepID=A0ACB8U1Z0_9APHY|nr:hypothetical protein BDY19DRAFT_951530 [Irpex rosettiformis]
MRGYMRRDDRVRFTSIVQCIQCIYPRQTSQSCVNEGFSNSNVSFDASWRYVC